MDENASSTDQSLLIGGGEDGDWMDLQFDYAVQARTAEMGVSPGNAVTA